MKLNQKTGVDVYTRVPFLGEMYSEFEAEINSQLYGANKSTLSNLTDLHHKLTMLQLKGQENSIEINSLVDLIVKGEDFLLQKCAIILTPLLDKIGRIAGDCADNVTFENMVEEDLLTRLLSMPKLMLPLILRNTILLQKYCRVVNPKCKSIERREALTQTITTAVYLLGTRSGRCKTYHRNAHKCLCSLKQGHRDD